MNRTDIARLGEGDYLRLLRRDRWEYVERINSRGIVVIAAATPAGKLLLVEQYRAAVRQPVIELPAGIVGDIEADEPLLDAARRELVEETGYAAGAIELACSGPITAGLANETHAFCIARDLERVGPGGGDESEEITVHEVSLADIDAWLANRPETVAVDPKIHIGLRLLARD
jgi:ADP-ribose pyrophosphatase